MIGSLTFFFLSFTFKNIFLVLVSCVGNNSTVLKKVREVQNPFISFCFHTRRCTLYSKSKHEEKFIKCATTLQKEKKKEY